MKKLTQLVFDEMGDVYPETEEDPYVPPPLVYPSEADRITVMIMGSLDCIINDEISDDRYDRAQARVRDIIKKEVFHEEIE